MARKGRKATITRMKPTEYGILPIPRDRDNTDDLVEAEQIVHAKFSPFPHPKRGRRGSFEGNTSSPQGPNNAVVKP